MKTTALDKNRNRSRAAGSRFISECVLGGCLLASANPICSKLNAQTFTTLYSFSGGDDGGRPVSTLALQGDTLYGSAQSGGINGYGTVFKLKSDGAGFTTLYKFKDDFSDAQSANPSGPLVIADGVIYGTASGIPFGSIFKVNTDGSGQRFLDILAFGANGTSPFGGVVLSSNILYGITEDANVFKVNTNGTGSELLHCLPCETNVGAAQTSTYSGLAMAGNYLYGTTYTGGAHNMGNLFKIGVDGAHFQIMHDFDGPEGARPFAGLLFYHGKLYGTTMEGGGTNAGGTVFVINTDGTGFTNLFRFTGLVGAAPQSVLICANNILYGTTSQGGGIGKAGIVFALNTDGTGFTNLYTFSGGSDGAAPGAGLTLSGNYLYGTTTGGGTYDKGTIFRLALPAAANAFIARMESNMVLSWPTNSTGTLLQSSTNLVDWVSISNSPAIVNGQYTMTNPISAAQQFFRVHHP